MKHRWRKGVLFVLGGALAAGLGYDLSRPRWLRLTTQVAEVAGGIIGVDLIDDPRRASTENEVRAYWLEDPLTLHDPCERRIAVWWDVQSGEFAFVPSLDVALVSPGCWWEMDTSTFFARLEELNPRAARLPDESHAVPPFLLLQEGGGVEGLDLQVALSQAGVLSVWRVHSDCGAQPEQLPEPSITTVPPTTVKRLFALASDPRLADECTVEWRYGWQDGGVVSISFFDGNHVGRVHHVNNVEPSGIVRDLAIELGRLAQKADPI